MLKIEITLDSEVNSIDFVEHENILLDLNSHKKIDNLLQEVNKSKYYSSMDILNYILNVKSPSVLDINKVTLLALLEFFQKKFIFKNFVLEFLDIQNFKSKIPWNYANIVVKPNNFPHLLGVKSERDEGGNILSTNIPRYFFDGVFHQWVLLDSRQGFDIDSEKLEVFTWIRQTLTIPTYILLSSAINNKKTKFMADLIFIRKIHNSKYSYHIVGLKNERDNNFALVSQFPIDKYRENRIYELFNLKKAIYNFYKFNKKTPISSGPAWSV